VPSERASKAKAARRGRPTEIDASTVALRAVAAFWRNGYDGTSLDDLVAATNVSRPGIYRTFGHKEALFLAAIDAYEHEITGQAIAAFEAEPGISLAVELFLSVSARNNASADTPSGCLMACCAVANAEMMPAVRDRLARAFGALEMRIIRRFVRETEAGRLPMAPSPETRAGLLLDFMTAQAVRARSGADLHALLVAIPAKRAAVLMDGPNYWDAAA